MATTDRAFTFATADGPLADLLRTRLAPLVIPGVMGLEPAREFLFRTVGQLALNYRGGPLSAGQAGRVHGGDRMPWVADDSEGNFQSLRDIAWHVHVYGSASAELAGWCADRGVGLSVFDWRQEQEAAGLAKGAAYLIRPDTYVALADPTGSPTTLERYSAEHGVTVGALPVN